MGTLLLNSSGMTFNNFFFAQKLKIITKIGVNSQEFIQLEFKIQI